MSNTPQEPSQAPKHADPDDEGLDLWRDDTTEPANEGEVATATRTARKKRKWPKIFLAALLAAVLLVVGVLFYYFRSISGALNEIHRDSSLMPDNTAVQPVETGKPINFVLMGTDNRAGVSGARSDSLILAQLSGDREHLYLVSFLRDMWVTVPANKVVKKDSKAKINAAYSWGGSALTIKTLQKLTGVQMDHAVIIDFPGFISLTDELGGVTVNNPQKSTIDGHTFAQGNITISGEEALLYVRERYDLANGDLDRAARQRSVITAIIEKSMSGGVISDPKKFKGVLDVYAKNTTVDSGLTTANIRKIATSLKFSSGKGVVQVQAPISGFGKSKDGQAYDIVDEAGMKELSTALKNDRMADYVANHPQ
ncbi:LytR family transcriptional regulator [Acidipropionibacterium jensenii]|uniref:LCP family protein n=1 Tax=Acidipropionibacterium jensenii TaxID=1749 RepID=UPI00110AF21D|nr:LCP family protein [Acidipropionibacterium jensenii]QCV87456.1 LytR family transcriptional regulator [Acidipropionibacterium jensenii]